jgi:hypothetical protein
MQQQFRLMELAEELTMFLRNQQMTATALSGSLEEEIWVVSICLTLKKSNSRK